MDCKKHLIIKTNGESRILISSTILFSEPIRLIRWAIIPKNSSLIELDSIYLTNWEVEGNKIKITGTTTKLDNNSQVTSATYDYIEEDEPIKKPRGNFIWQDGEWYNTKNGRRQYAI